MATRRTPRCTPRGARRLAIAVAWLFAAAFSGAAAWAAEPAEPTVIILSWDGTRWDYPDRTALPALERLEAHGTRRTLVPVFPTSTFSNHVSLATGTYVDRHGIVGNEFDDPKLGHYRYSADAAFLEAEPVWIAAERQGVRAASFFWVGSETPWRGRAATHRKTPFDAGIGEAEKVDQILAWLDLPEAERPRLILSWWHGADRAGHRNGPDAPEITDALVAQDEQLGRLLAGLDARNVWPSTTLLVVSDHGMTLPTVAIDPVQLLADAGIEAKAYGGGGSAYLRLGDPTRIPRALETLNAAGGMHAYAADTLPAGLRARSPARTGHITIIASPPNTISTKRDSLVERALVAFARWIGHPLGSHGYEPHHRDMHAIFYAMGRGVAPGRPLQPVRSIDVAPTIAALLGIDPPADAEGVPIPGVAPARRAP